MSDREMREMLAQLIAKLAMHKAMVLADPEPWLDKLAKHSGELLAVLREVEYALSPDMVFDTANEMGIRPVDFQGEALVRCNKALGVLRKYRMSPNTI
jgi:hypothetical protein